MIRLTSFMRILVFLMLLYIMSTIINSYVEGPSRRVRIFLNKIDLGKYYPDFKEAGYDRLQDVYWATENDLEHIVGIKIRPHRERILRFAKMNMQPSLFTSSFSILILIILTAFITSLFLSETVRRTSLYSLTYISLYIWFLFNLYILI